jgi:hypothetical protein
MTLVNCLLNAIVSEDAHFGALDIADYCSPVGAEMPEDDMQSLKMSVPLIQVGPPGYFVHIHIAITTPIVSALKNYYT